MARQVLVVGLGQFGMALARHLSARGVEVLAVDLREEAVAAAAAFAEEAVALDATDEEALARLAPAARDVCVCAIGQEAREASIVTTALLRQMGAKKLLARATDPLHERILKLVGAHEVINPEARIGERLAGRLARDGLLDLMPLGDELVISEIASPPAFAGRTLAQLKLPSRHGVTVIAIRRVAEGAGRYLLPAPDVTLVGGDVLVTISTPGAVDRLLGGAA
jgi:trk system potassium uptake protein TrkA